MQCKITDGSALNKLFVPTPGTAHRVSCCFRSGRGTTTRYVLKKGISAVIQFQEETVVNAKPETIFAIYEDVDGWYRWDPDVQSSNITGAFVAGTEGKLKPKNGPLVKMRLTHVEKNRSFTDETALPLCKIQFEHQLIPEGKTTRVLHRVSFSGPLGFFFGRVIGKQIKHGLPEALSGLKAKAEKQLST